MIQWYKDKEKKIIDSTLLDNVAKSKAEYWTNIRIGSLSPTQLRRYYGEIKNIERQFISLGSNTNAWNIVEPLVKMVKAKVSYDTRQSKQNKIPEEFKQFLFESIDSIKDERDFKAFLKYFEACVGFYSAKVARQ